MAQQNRDPIPVARKAFDLLLAEKYSELRSMFNQKMLDALSEDALRNQVGPQIKALGKPEKIGDAKVQKIQDVDVVVFPVKFPAGNFNLVISVDDSGKIAGLFIRPGEAPKSSAWTAPPYVHPNLLHEREVTVGSGDWKLPGTLTVPNEGGRFPGVVLVHGSGPNDRDETVFAAKPFRDFAEGLASRGIAVLRYEKRTKLYAPQLLRLKDFTVQQETVDDALQAISLIRQQPEIASNRIYLLGHSLGGYLGPRIARLDGKLAGLIILAGSVRPIQDLIVQQYEYLGANPEQLRKAQEDAAKVNTLKPGGENPPALFGLPSSYWLDLQHYDPVAEASALKCRLLILQGGRDYQVTKEDFELWQRALKNRANVTLHVYPALNHLFVSGTGKSLPSEYSKPGHVDPAVIEDVADWINA
jgi:dienelactone hydrolase